MGVLTPVPRGRAPPHWFVPSGLNPKCPRTQAVALGSLEAAPFGASVTALRGRIKPPRSFRFIAPPIRVHWRLFAVDSFDDLATRFMVQTGDRFLEVPALQGPPRMRSIRILARNPLLNPNLRSARRRFWHPIVGGARPTEPPTRPAESCGVEHPLASNLGRGFYRRILPGIQALAV